MTTQTEALKRIASELRHYNPLADKYKGEFIHKGWATRIEELLAQPEQEPVSEIMREMLDVQGQHGNWNYDSYMHGLYNGMEYMVALAEKREPKFRDAPEVWLAKYEVKRNNFNNTESLTEVTTPPQRKPLTDERIDYIYDQLVAGQLESIEEQEDDPMRIFARAIEAAHGIKE